MNNYLWSKEGFNGPNETIQKFLAGKDVLLDRYLFLFDIRATIAHIHGLERIDVLTKSECQKLEGGLKELSELFESGEFILDAPHEDSHSAIEFWLTEQLGPIGGKIHTGRSRNDQVQVALRLYMVDRLDKLTYLTKKLSENLLNRAEEMHDWAMPGYTHLQRAVPSSVGLWLGGMAEAFCDITQLVVMTKDWLNTSPLGSAAGYGVNLPLDREGVAKDLGFDHVQINPQYVQNSRGRFELQALSTLAQATLEMRRLAWDLSLYTSSEFLFVNIPEKYVTGSSIMPNKRNPDVVELLRASHGIVEGAMVELQSTINLPSGYHRDLQMTKRPLIRAFEESLPALEIMSNLVLDMNLNKLNLLNAIDKDMYATDMAIDAALEGGTFREAYKTAMQSDQLVKKTPKDSLDARVSLGGCANLGLDQIKKRLGSF
ncbi:MAG: argininosuccinate lyase [Sphingomonadales bacterium]|jgi:argininosuccinate lyase